MKAKMPEQNESLMLLKEAEEIKREAMDYDDSSWTREELEALAWERVKTEEWDEYDQLADYRV